MQIYDDKIIYSNVISITRGSDYNDTITIKRPDAADPADRSLDTPIDLTGYVIESQIRDIQGNLKATITCSIVSAIDGKLKRNIPSADTLLLEASTDIRHVWGLQLSHAVSGILPELQGGVVVKPEVVHA